ncbi:glycosyltransferase [Empedobacter falsenii]
MIPKKIHYCWFGRGKKSDLIEFCINSWKKYNPTYEIIEWNEDNFDVNSNIYVQEAYSQKKWAFVSDYARAKILFEEGGFYLDTDMEIKHSLDEFINYQAICGFEIKGTPFSAFWAVEKAHLLAKDIKEYYENQNSFSEIPNTFIFSKLLVDKYGANATEDKFQELKEGIQLFPSHYFSLDLPINYITHHFSGSWHGAWTTEENSFKNYVNTYGIVKMFTDIPNGKKELHNLIFNQNIFDVSDILNQIPFKLVFKYVMKKIFQNILK